MVGHAHEIMKREISPKERTGHDDRLGRIPEGLGGSLPQSKDRRSMVPSRKGDTHQLPRAQSSNSGCPDFPEKPKGSPSPAENRHHYSSGVHQQPWGNSLQGALGPSQDTVDVVSGEEHPHHLPGVLKSIAAAESREMVDWSDWQLDQ